MKISKKSPLYSEDYLTDIIIISKQHINHLQLKREHCTEITNINIEDVTYSDKEGFTSKSGSRGNLAMTSAVNKDNTDDYQLETLKNKLTDYSQGLLKSEDNHVILVVPSHLKNTILEILPKSIVNKISYQLDKNLTKTHTSDLLNAIENHVHKVSTDITKNTQPLKQYL